MTISKGIDVSEDQGMIDWETVKAQIDYAIIRVGYGENNIDSQFVRNISECNRLGIPVGAYWFSYALNAKMARAEAEYCIAALQPYKVTYPVAFDFEYDSAAYAQENGIRIHPEPFNPRLGASGISAGNSFGYYRRRSPYGAVPTAPNRNYGKKSL